VEQRIAARPATVFSFLIDPVRFVEWMGVGAELNPEPGGAFRIDIDGQHFARGEYREVEPPHRLVMSWGWEGDAEVAPGTTTVEITLTADEDGTILRLRHTGLPNQAQTDAHRDGWTMYTEKLKARLSGS
jgi:uncharacterized protein YndB with AHSA1/START domain